MAAETLKIQQVAEKTGLSIYTLRYYELEGLVAPVPREKNGHRAYSEDDIYSIIFVTKLRAAGMPIADIRRYVELARQGESTAGERLQILEEHKCAVEQQLAELTQHLEVITFKIDYYRNLNGKGHDGC
ncbi:MAG: MerR family transcriptional regulator [Anaerolineae bacterium]|nr:MerR family transcriptional regulator [Anaerolineae bacterium]